MGKFGYGNKLWDCLWSFGDLLLVFGLGVQIDESFQGGV